MLLIDIDYKSKIPIFKQIVTHIQNMIENGILQSGDKIPSTRLLAKQLGLNRNTVFKAYEELWALGYIESKSGSYSTVRKRIVSVDSKQTSEKNLFSWQEKITQKALELVSENKTKNDLFPGLINFTPLSPDPEIIPADDYRKCINDILRFKSKDLFLYGSPSGYLPLREFVAKHMHMHSVQVNYSEVVITNGAQNAIELIFKLLLNPGDAVIIEKPTYSAIIPLLKQYQATVYEVPVKENGLDLAVLQSYLESKRIKLLYIMPNFQNPTGVTTDQSHREKLMDLCNTYNVPVIEDGFVEEMKYFGKNILPVKSMDKKGLVFYTGTFSKVLFPGLRLGWIASNEYCTNRFAELIKSSEISGNMLDQAALELFCSKGYYEMQLKRVHKVYKKRMFTALKTLRENLNAPQVNYTKPIGGYTIWFEINHGIITEDDVIKRLHNKGVMVTPGSLSFFSKSEKISFRISIAHCNEQQIEQGIKIISKVLNSL